MAESPVLYVYYRPANDDAYPGVPNRHITEADWARFSPSQRRTVEQATTQEGYTRRKVWVHRDLVDETEQERADREAAEQAARDAYERGQSIVRWRDFESLVPGPGEVVVGSADGPVALSSAPFLRLPMHRPLRMVGIGDSITDGGADYKTENGLIWQHGKASWLQFAASRSLGHLHLVKNAAISGDNTTGMLSRIDSVVIPAKPDVVIMLGGANDLSNNVPVATLRGNIAAIHAKLQAAGVALALCTLTPRDPADPLDTTRLRRTQEHNAWLRNYAQMHGLLLIDLYAATADPATGGWRDGYSYDTLHPTELGGRVMGDTVIRAVLGSQPTTPALPLPVTAGDSTNLVPNALFLTDTSGTPTGWSKNGTAASTFETTEGVPGRWWTITQGTSGASRMQVQITNNLGNPGDIFAVMGRIKATGFEAGAGKWDMTARWMDAGSQPRSPLYMPLGSDKIVDVEDSVFYVEFAKPDDPTITRMDVRAAIDIGTGSLSIAQVAIRNLTALGLA